MGLSARLFEIVFRSAYINAHIMHSYLPQKERMSLAKDFTDLSLSLTVLIQL